MRWFYGFLAVCCLFGFFGALGDGRPPQQTVPLLALTLLACWRAERS